MLGSNIVQLRRKEKAAGVNTKLQVSRSIVRAWEDSAIHTEDLFSILSFLWPERLRRFCYQRKSIKQEAMHRKPSPAYLGCSFIYTKYTRERYNTLKRSLIVIPIQNLHKIRCTVLSIVFNIKVSE